MRRYKNFSPTAFDTKGLALPEQQDWYVAPCSITRDSGILDVSNWGTMLKCLEEIDPDGADHEICRFGHWACGWFEIVIVREDSACYTECERIESALDNYSVLDEFDFSEREADERGEYFNPIVEDLYDATVDFLKTKDPDDGYDLSKTFDTLEKEIGWWDGFYGVDARAACKRVVTAARKGEPVPYICDIIWDM